ncbi:hypothetical protein CDIK_2450 [Cucumispora dikerogammari]|nr:hypothetical protein CDIK_2450 [Cucumispora dikerogammari]
MTDSSSTFSYKNVFLSFALNSIIGSKHLSYLKQISYFYGYFTDIINKNITNDKKLFKNERDVLSSSLVINILFYIIIPNINLLLSICPSGYIYMRYRKVFTELKLILMNIERMPWLNEFIPFTKQIKRVKMVCRDFEVLCSNLDKVVNWGKRILFLEKLRILVSSVLAVIRLICLGWGADKRRGWNRRGGGAFNNRGRFNGRNKFIDDNNDKEDSLDYDSDSYF